MIITTTDHPFYTDSGEWILAGDLQIGDAVVSADGDFGTVDAVVSTDGTAEVYNLTVDEAHTYFVGDGAWLVHNACNPNRDRTLKQFLRRSEDIRRELRIKPGKRNVGIADYTIDGRMGILEAVSGETNHPGFVQLRNENDRTFQTFIGGGGRGPVDTEAKILEEISSRFNPNSSGRIVLYTDRPPCPSCSGVINQFEQRHPNIQVEVIKGNLRLNTQ